MNALIRYEEMRVAVESCARIDEAAEIKDKAAALQAYARQRDDADLEVWTAEIKLRASVRIGELVRELDAEHPRDDGGRLVPKDGKKADAIAEAGLSKSEAYRFQELAGPRNEQAQTAGKAAAEHYFASARAEKKPATMEGLRGAIRSAVRATVGPPPERKAIEKPKNPVGAEWLDWTAAVKHLATADADLSAMARRLPAANAMLRAEADQALLRLEEWINVLESEDEREIGDAQAVATAH